MTTGPVSGDSPVQVLYLVLDTLGECDLSLFRITRDPARAQEIARNIGGIAVSVPVHQVLADFRHEGD